MGWKKILFITLWLVVSIGCMQVGYAESYDVSMVNTFEMHEQNDYAWFKAVEDISPTNLPSDKIIWGLLIMYLFILGGGSVFVLKTKNKKTYIGLIVPVISIGVTLILCGIGMKFKEVSCVTRQLNVINIDDAGRASENSYIGVLSTKDEKIVVAETDTVEFRRTFPSEIFEGSAKLTDNNMKHFVFEQNSYDTTIFMTKPKNIEAPQYSAIFTAGDNQYDVKFINNDQQQIKMLLVMFDNKIWNLGSLKQGDIVEKKLMLEEVSSLKELINTCNENKDYEMVNILESVERVSKWKYSSVPYYCAILKNKEGLQIIKNNCQTQFNYSVIMKKMNINTDVEGQVFYPYDYFESTIISQKGFEEYTQVPGSIVLRKNMELELMYQITPNINVSRVIIGFNKEGATKSYYEELKGDVYIYNNTTKKYELLDIHARDEYVLEDDELNNYLNERSILVKVVGRDENNALAPSIKVEGISEEMN